MPDVGTLYTLEFIRSQLPHPRSRILEIGCGTGALAELLMKDGHSVIAIDSDADAISQAALKGVDALDSELAGLFSRDLRCRSIYSVASPHR